MRRSSCKPLFDKVRGYLGGIAFSIIWNENRTKLV